MPLTKDQKIVLAGAAAVGVLYFGLLNPLFKFLGIKDTAETKNLDLASQNPGSPWNPNFYKSISNAPLMQRVYTESLARSVYDSFGLFDDNEEQAIAVIKSIQFQTQLSWLADIFYQLYNQDLLTFLRGGNWPQDRLSDADVNALNSFILKLPVK